MSALPVTALSFEVSTSCGTLIVNKKGQLLLCHATNSRFWDLPKGRRDPGESSLEAAVRELREETGLVLDSSLFTEIGCFAYNPDKNLHLFQVTAPDELESLNHLVCTSFFLHPETKEPTPEMDGYRWAIREEISQLCRPRMAARLLSLEW